MLQKGFVCVLVADFVSLVDIFYLGRLIRRM